MIATVSAYTRTPCGNVWENTLALSGLEIKMGRILPRLERGPGLLERVEVCLKVAADKRGLELAQTAFIIAGIRVDVHATGRRPDGTTVLAVYGDQLTLRTGEKGSLTKTDWPEFDLAGWSHWKWKSPDCIAREERRLTAVNRFFDSYTDGDMAVQS